MSFDRKAHNKAYREANPEKIKAQKKAYREANREKENARSRAYNKANSEKIRAYRKAPHEANRENNNARSRAYYHANCEKRKASSKAYHQANPEKIKALKKAYREANRERANAWCRSRYASDPLFKLSITYRTTIARGFKRACFKKDAKSLDCLGCSWEEFQDHIQSQFYDRAETGEKMTFENHGYYGWHLDHITPISSAKTKEDVIRLSHYTNFQPLWSEDNYEKGDYFLDNDEQIS